MDLLRRASTPPAFRLLARVFLMFVLALPVATTAGAEVRFGSNVRVGGHDFSNRTYNRDRRALIRLRERQPRRPGCVWRTDRRGGKVQVCDLRRIRR